MMNSSGLECEVCVVHFKWIKGERWWIQSKVLLKFVIDLMDEIDYKLYLNQDKTKLPSCPLF